ncbi:MAG: ATP-binding protein [Candidatus Aminicenantes bacterium]|nr:ATP-binding protein [Candidatus Aminicenantes bacterium]
MNEPRYSMSMSLSVLKQLGINLYSAIPPVLSEAVANAWDADAEEVEITISGGEVVIEDDGHGMTVEDANKKYLFIGYERRKDDGAVTPRLKRKVMGRKGIGKLSLFSIANIVEVHTAKNGERHGFRMNVSEIEQKIKESQGNAEYDPTPLCDNELRITREKGTIIVLKELRKKGLTKAVSALRKRIAWRFGIIGEKYNFKVKINGEYVTPADRDYFKKNQYLWYFGQESQEYKECCDLNKLKHSEQRGNEIKPRSNGEPDENEKVLKVTGWIGSVNSSGDLKDEAEHLNKIVIMVRGKLAQEDILEDFSEGRIFSKYLVGVIHADFLDNDDEDDAATSNRQEIIKDDPRYEALKAWVNTELKYIGNKWTDLRKEGGTEKALEIKSINNWFNRLSGDDKEYAKILFGKLNQLPTENEDIKNELFKQSVLAFENLKYKRKLKKLEKINAENLDSFTEALADFDDIEATLYYQIIKERLCIIENFKDKVIDNALEDIIKKYLFDHLWLLDPSWDRATETPLMEQQIKRDFGNITNNLTEEEKRGRVDIKYKNSAGKHIIIELKRASVTLSTPKITEQILKYKKALVSLLALNGRGNEPVEVIVLIGKNLKDWENDKDKEDSRKSLEAYNTRVITYQKLIEDAYRAYGEFLKKNQEAGNLTRLIEEIDIELSNK